MDKKIVEVLGKMIGGIASAVVAGLVQEVAQEAIQEYRKKRGEELTWYDPLLIECASSTAGVICSGLTNTAINTLSEIPVPMPTDSPSKLPIQNNLTIILYDQNGKLVSCTYDGHDDGKILSTHNPEEYNALVTASVFQHHWNYYPQYRNDSTENDSDYIDEYDLF